MLKVERPISSPKQSGAARRNSPFPYYAGFSESFVESCLTRVGFQRNQVVLDPWNGSGTTTSVASSLGCHAVGVDLNPALSVVARARLANVDQVLEARRILTNSKGKLSPALVRDLCSCPYTSSVKSLITLLIFRAVRSNLKLKELGSSNPTWWRASAPDVIRTIQAITVRQLVVELDSLLASGMVVGKELGQVNLVRGDLLSVDLPITQADIILTSPPYLTRIDYVKATLPELLVLSHIDDFDIETLRLQMIGSPVVGRGPMSVPIYIGDYAKEILGRVSVHSSKASATYYLAFFSSYISKMQSAIQRLGDLSHSDTKLVLVVQGSYYKEIYVDLAKICIDIACFSGFSLFDRRDFGFKQSFSQINPKANGYSVETAKETVLFFERKS